MTKLQSALQLAELGFYVFRVKRDDKRPYNIGWQDEATRDPKQLAIDFADKDFNIGVFADKFDDNSARSKALVIIDVDTKEGKVGNLTMQGLDALGYDFPATLEAATASGGRHLFYWHDLPVKGGNNVLGENVDVKSKGGYVLGAGSTIGEKFYVFISNAPIAKCPDWIVQKCGYVIRGSQADDIWDDSPQNVERGRLYIENNAPEANLGNRNDYVYKTATWLRDYGLPYVEARALMESYNEFKVNPRMPEEELLRTIDSAYKTATNAAGIRNPNNNLDFEADPDAPDEMPYIGNGAPETKEPTSFEIKRPATLKATLNTSPLIEDMLDQKALSILYGASNAGKTFVAMDLAYHIATGKDWAGKRTTPGEVIYIAAEGGLSAENRVQALKQFYNQDDFGLGLINSPINLFDSAKDIKGLVESIETYQATLNAPVKMIVIDTLSRALAGGNENDSQDMGEFVKNVDYIRQRLNTHLMIVHHTGKDQARGARGHSLLRAAVDTELEVADDVITTKKQRDMEFSPPIGFELEVITLGQNTYDKDVTSCVIKIVEAKRKDFSLDAREQIVFMALMSIKTGRKLRDYDNVVDEDDWRKSCKLFDYRTVSAEIARKKLPSSKDSFNKAFAAARKSLQAREMIVKVDKEQWTIINRGSEFPEES